MSFLGRDRVAWAAGTRRNEGKINAFFQLGIIQFIQHSAWKQSFTMMKIHFVCYFVCFSIYHMGPWLSDPRVCKHGPGNTVLRWALFDIVILLIYSATHGIYCTAVLPGRGRDFPSQGTFSEVSVWLEGGLEVWINLINWFKINLVCFY